MILFLDIENNIIDACREERRRQWLYELARDLQDIPDERLEEFCDCAWLKELKKKYAAGCLDPVVPSAAQSVVDPLKPVSQPASQARTNGP